MAELDAGTQQMPGTPVPRLDRQPPGDRRLLVLVDPAKHRRLADVAYGGDLVLAAGDANRLQQRFVRGEVTGVGR